MAIRQSPCVCVPQEAEVSFGHRATRPVVIPLAFPASVLMMYSLFDEPKEILDDSHGAPIITKNLPAANYLSESCLISQLGVRWGLLKLLCFNPKTIFYLNELKTLKLSYKKLVF